MDVREKLVELLAWRPCESDCEGKLGSCPSRKNGNCGEIFKLSYCATSKLADHLIAHGVTVQEWVSVDDMLPDRGQNVWCYSDQYGGYFFSGYRGCYSGEWMEGSFRHTGKVTNWMPLPHPPK